MIISEVTSPPFFGGTLPDLYVEVTVVPQKASSSRDTISVDKLLQPTSSSSSSSGGGGGGRKAAVGKSVPRSKSKLLLSLQHKGD